MSDKIGRASVGRPGEKEKNQGGIRSKGGSNDTLYICENNKNYYYLNIKSNIFGRKNGFLHPVVMRPLRVVF